MNTKELRTSGGDFTTLDEAVAYVAANIQTDDIDILMEPGIRFSEVSAGSLDMSDADFNGHTVTFKTDPSWLATPATFKGTIFLVAESESSNAGKINFENLILMPNADGFGLPVAADAASHPNVDCKITNCVTYWRGDGSASVKLFLPAVGMQTELYNATLVLWNTDRIRMGDDGGTKMDNCLVVTYFDHIEDSFEIYMSGSQNYYNNTFYNYGNAPFNFQTPTDMIDIEVGDPNFIVDALVAFDEALETVVAKDIRLTENSTLCIDNGYATTAPAIDIIGTVRPQGEGDDRGAYEFGATSPTPVPDFTFEDGDFVRDVDKFSTSENNYEADILVSLAKEDAATVNKNDILDGQASIKGAGFNPTTDTLEKLRDKLDLLHTDVGLDFKAYEYDFTTYAKAVMLFYDEDRPFMGDPVAWCYIYTAAGAKPVNTSEIAKRDTVIYWSVSTPT